jgi:hypothetical protein
MTGHGSRDRDDVYSISTNYRSSQERRRLADLKTVTVIQSESQTHRPRSGSAHRQRSRAHSSHDRSTYIQKDKTKVSGTVQPPGVPARRWQATRPTPATNISCIKKESKRPTSSSTNKYPLTPQCRVFDSSLETRNPDANKQASLQSVVTASRWRCISLIVIYPSPPGKIIYLIIFRALRASSQAASQAPLFVLLRRCGPWPPSQPHHSPHYAAVV